jgi:ABC-type branched-subunit amino acid transport system substrate-binding protein
MTQRRLSRTLTLTSAIAVTLALAGCGENSRRGGDAAATPGVTDDTIVLGMTSPLTGPAASYADAGKALTAYFDSVNAEGGINGRKVQLIIRDDAYDPAKTVSQTSRLVDSDNVLALVGGVGSATQLAVYDQMNDHQVPTLLINSPLDQFGSPVLPYVSMMLPSTTNEQTNLISFAKEEYQDAKVGILFQNDDVGHAMTDAWSDAYGDDVVAAESYNATDTDVADQITALREAGANLVVFLSASKFTALGLIAMERQGWEAPRIAQSNGFDASVVETAGKAADGVITASALKPFDSNDPAVASARDILARYGKDVEPSQISMLGISEGIILESILGQAGTDLTRSSLMAAHDALNLTAPAPWWGTVELTDEDHSALQCEQLLRNQGGKLSPVGDVICPPVPSPSEGRIVTSGESSMVPDE